MSIEQLLHRIVEVGRFLCDSLIFGSADQALETVGRISPRTIPNFTQNILRYIFNYFKNLNYQSFKFLQ